MEVIDGKVVALSPDGLTVFVPYQNTERALVRQYDVVRVGLVDGRTISPDQRKKSHALLGEIADWQGDLPEYVKRLMKVEFMASRMQAIEKKIFSHADTDVTTAKEFITFLVDFIIEHDIPTRVPLQELCEDIPKYVYACALHRKCAVCGKLKADLHHCDKVGMGNNRTEICHIGRRAITLCREHHQETEQTGDVAFFEKYHLSPIVLDEVLVKKLKLKGKKES